MSDHVCALSSDFEQRRLFRILKAALSLDRKAVLKVLKDEPELQDVAKILMSFLIPSTRANRVLITSLCSRYQLDVVKAAANYAFDSYGFNLPPMSTEVAGIVPGLLLLSCQKSTSISVVDQSPERMVFRVSGEALSTNTEQISDPVATFCGEITITHCDRVDLQIRFKHIWRDPSMDCARHDRHRAAIYNLTRWGFKCDGVLISRQPIESAPDVTNELVRIGKRFRQICNL